jgi:signal transduction histidine kinase
LTDASTLADTAQKACEKTIRLLPSYVEQLAGVWNSDRSLMASELSQLTTLVDHVKDVIRIQQDYARGGSHVESIELASIVDDALTTIRDASASANILIEKSIVQQHEVCGDRHKLLQILINLVSNATHALSASEANDRRISIRVGQDDVTTTIAVEDSGIGIAEEDMTKIFQLGFTTKRNGHGFGLHSSALLAIEMDGRLTVASQGRGCGATFTLAFPHSQQNNPPLELPCPQSQYALNEC